MHSIIIISVASALHSLRCIGKGWEEGGETGEVHRARHSNASQIQTRANSSNAIRSFVALNHSSVCVSQSVSQPACCANHCRSCICQLSTLSLPPHLSRLPSLRRLLFAAFAGTCVCIHRAAAPAPALASQLVALSPSLPRRPSSFSLRFFVPGHSFASLCENSAFTSLPLSLPPPPPPPPAAAGRRCHSLMLRVIPVVICPPRKINDP